MRDASIGWLGIIGIGCTIGGIWVWFGIGPAILLVGCTAIALSLIGAVAANAEEKRRKRNEDHSAEE